MSAPTFESWQRHVERELGRAWDALGQPGRAGVVAHPLYVDALPAPSAMPVDVELLALSTGAGRHWCVAGSTTDAWCQEQRVNGDHQLRRNGRLVTHALDLADAAAPAAAEVGTAVARWARTTRDGEPSPAIALAVGTELGAEIAKLRAARVLLERVSAHLGVPGPRLWVRTSFVPLTTMSAETNAIRATLGTMAALIAGADVIATAPFDLLTGASERGLRLAATTGLVARLEGHLASGFDAASGSFAIEHWTQQLVREAWDHVRALERGELLAFTPSPAARRVGATQYVEPVPLLRVLPCFDHVVRDSLTAEAAHVQAHGMRPEAS